MKSLSVAAMKEADRRCIEDIGIPGAVLMNNAGQAVANRIDRGPVGVICGKGNNGGDGFVVARLTLLAGLDTRVVLVADPTELKGDALTFFEAYRKLGGHVIAVTDDDEVRHAIHNLADCTVIVDALLGTGITGEVRGVYRTVIESWPQVHTIAVDVPSGLDADTGEACGCAVRAEETVTMQFSKKGFDMGSAQAHLGRLIVADIGIPAICGDDAAWRQLRGQA